VSAVPTGPHRIVNPDGLLPPVGFSHAVVAAPGRLVQFGGQTGHHADGSLPDGLVAQFEQAVRNLVVALRAVGAAPEHLTALQIYVSDMAGYRDSLPDVGAAYRRHLGHHYPAVALLGVESLFDPHAVVELVATAVVPGDDH
jgi:enamine deaminase RidA (YjgF/YER057c/UK114 family)